MSPWIAAVAANLFFVTPSGQVTHAHRRIPAVVGTGPLLTSANSLNSVSNGAVRLIGGPIGGILFAALGIRVLIVADALSYLVAAGAIASTARETSQAPAPSKVSVSQLFLDMREGLAILMRERSARALLPVSVIFLAANACLTSVVVAFGLTQLGGSRATGLLFSALGVGFLAGAPVIAMTLDRISARHLMFGSLAATAVSYLVLFHSTSLRSALPAAVAIGLFGSLSLMVPQTAVQRVIPNEALGRISAVFLTGEAAATLAGALIGPLLVRSIDLHGLAAVASLATAAAAALTLVLVPSRAQQPSTAPTAAQGR